MPVEKLTPSFTFTEERLQALQAVVPEAFADGQVNWETLKAALEPFLEDEGPGTEHFGLFWPGKRQARRLAAQPSKGTLRPVLGEGVNEDTTHNLFIEGDNLEVLKLLQKSYAGRVKLIYIDPPYNTGNDFVYKDDFREPLEEYLQRTGQADAEGLLTTNPKSSGRFHSEWLNMMLPRLMLARTLLSEDGVIFVSIDDNEAANLRILMDEIFGNENFLCAFAWEKRYSPPPDTKDIGYLHETIIFFRKSDEFTGTLLPLTEEQKSRYKNPDDDPRGPWKQMDYTCRYSADERPTLYYPVIQPNTGLEIWPKKNRVWAMSKKVHENHALENRIWWGIDGKNSTPSLKNFLSEIKQGMMPVSLLKHESVGHTDEATKELRNLIPEIKFNPKPTKLIKHLIKIASNEDSLIIDFFAGSCTTAHAVLELNREDGGNRHFIMVQIPEPTPPDSSARQAGYKTIADIGKERIRRVIAKLDKQPVLDRDTPEDLGFAVYQLDRSHFKAWHDYDGNDPAQLDDLFSQHQDPLIAGWHPRTLLDEILLLQGFPLDSRRTRLNDFPHNALIQVECDWFSYRLFVCLDAILNPATIARLSLNPDDKFIGLDSALTDQTKQELTDRCTLVVL